MRGRHHGRRRVEKPFNAKNTHAHTVCGACNNHAIYADICRTYRAIAVMYTLSLTVHAASWTPVLVPLYSAGMRQPEISGVPI